MTNLSTTATTTLKLAINTPKYYYKFRTINSILTQISFPYIFIVVCIGLITNTSTMVLLSKGFVTKNLKHKWTLVALALSDLIHNIALSIRVIHDIIGGRIEFLCIVISFLSHLAELLSACFTVLFTIQRYAAVRYPLQAAFPERTSPIISIVPVFVCSVSFCVALSYFNLYIDCHEELKLSWFIADAFASFIIPFSLILIFNILIVSLIRKHARSPFTVPSVLPKMNRRLKRDKNHKFKKLNRSKDSFSLTGSYGIALTSHGTIIETDLDRRLTLNISSVRSNNSRQSTDSSIRTTRAQFSIFNETEFQSNDPSLPLVPIENSNSNGLSQRYSLPNSHLIKLEQDTHRRNTLVSSNMNQSRRLSRLSNDLDFISNKSSQTTQSVRVTRMLVIVSTCFLILNAPAHLCVIALKFYTGINSPVNIEQVELEKFRQIKNLTNTEENKFVFIQENADKVVETTHTLNHDTSVIDDQITIHLFYIAILLTQLISYASYSINFFLYSFSGVAFRTSLRQIFNKRR